MSDGLPRSVDASAGVGVTPSEAPLGEGHVHDEIDVELDERDDARPSSPSPSVGLKAKARPRPRMTLRIPDDEVARPLSAPPPEPSPPSRAEIAPNRIITINSPPRPGPSSPAPKAAEADETAPIPVPPSSPTLPDATLSTSSDVSLPEPADEPLEVVSVDAVAPPPPPETAPILPPSVIPRPAPLPSVPAAAAPARPAVPRPSPSTPAAAGSVRPPPPAVARTLPSSPPPRPPSLSPPSLTPPAPPVDGVGRLPPPPRIATETEPPPDSEEEASPVPSEDFEDAESTAPTPPPPPAQAGALGTLPPIPTPPAVPRRLSTPADPTPALVNHAESFARKPASAESPESDSLEIPVEEDEEFSRVSEPEILADDLVSVDAALDDAPKPPPAPAAPAPTKKSSLPPAAASSSPTVSSLLTSSPGQASLAVSGEISVVRNSSEPPSPEPPPFAPPRAPDVAPPPPQSSSASVSYSELSPPPMSDAAAQRKRGRPWWEELFNDDFIRTMAKISDEQIAEEADFIEDSLGVAKGAMILDLACGTGRHAIELTRRGYQVVGYDLSLSMLARAADEAQDRNQKLNFVQGDMREMTFEETFDGIYSWSTSFGFFEEEKNAQVIGRVHRALRKGGQFLLDVVNRDFIGRQAPSLAWFEGEGCICMDEMQIDWITSRMRVKRTMMMDDGRSKEIEYSIRLYSLHELGRLLHDHGFRVAEVSGRVATPGVFFGSDSPRTLILAEKR